MHKKRAEEHESGRLHGHAEINGSPRGRALDSSSSVLNHSYQMDDQEKKIIFKVKHAKWISVPDMLTWQLAV